MPHVASLGLIALLSLTVAPATRGATLEAQQQNPDSSISQSVLEVFARTHIAVSALRDRYQAEFAEPRSKKPEVQEELRLKFQRELQEVLKSNGLSELDFARLTRRVATDSATRIAFERAVSQAEARKPGASAATPKSG